MLAILTMASATLVSPMLVAQQSDKPNISVKCFVELFGGDHSIYFARLSELEYERLPRMLVNQKVYTADKSSKIKVYAVRECALEKDKFKSTIANKLEATIPK